MQRYNLTFIGNQDAAGQWVRYDDHQAAIDEALVKLGQRAKAAEERESKLQAELIEWQDSYRKRCEEHNEDIKERDALKARAEKAEAELAKVETQLQAEVDKVLRLENELESADGMISHLNSKLAEQAKELAAAKREESGGWRNRLVIPFRTHLAAVQAAIPKDSSLTINPAGSFPASFSKDCQWSMDFEQVVRWLAPEDRGQVEQPKHPAWERFIRKQTEITNNWDVEVLADSLYAVLAEMRKELGLAE